jgi:serine/threonine-protein kinase SRPK3
MSGKYGFPSAAVLIATTAKSLPAEATDAPELHELEYLQRMSDRDDQHPGHSHVLQLQDHFYHEGPNGRHLCIVTELLSESVTSFSFRWKNDRMPQALAKHVTRQIILGLDYLHNTCGILHTGKYQVVC